MAQKPNKRSRNIKRRELLKATALAGLSMSLPEVSEAASAIEWSALNNESRMPCSQAAWVQKIRSRPVSYSGLVTSLRSESSYECEIKGRLPDDLKGTLFRTGPGLFDRGGMRRRVVIDADGMLRKFQIQNGKAYFSNRHVRTQKFVDEEKAGKYIYPSFAMHVPKHESIFTNSLARIQNQASVCAFMFGRKLFVTDEIQPLTQLDPNNLNTLGEVTINGEKRKFMAHYRITQFGTKKLHLAEFDPMRSTLRVLTYNEQFKCIETSQSVKVQRSFHDWHATQDYFLFLLPPVYMSGTGIAKALAGLATAADGMEFKADEKTQILIIPRDGRPAKILSLPEALDSWHSINAYQVSSTEIMYDFVASTKRTSAASNKSEMSRIMRGEVERNKGARPSAVYRALLNYSRNHVTYGRDYFRVHGVEMPSIDARLYGKSYQNAYFIAGQDTLDTQIVRLDIKAGTSERYDFGPNRFVTEPIVAPSQNGTHSYLLSEVYSGDAKRSYLAVFNAENLRQGPVAEIWLKHHLPMGFHGFWQP